MLYSRLVAAAIVASVGMAESLSPVLAESRFTGGNATRTVAVASWRQGIAATRQENYSQAIQQLQQAARTYRSQNRESEAYLSQLLSQHTQHLVTRHQQYQLPYNPNPPASEDNILMGSCLGTDCNYGIEWYSPTTRNNRYRGILVLHKRIRYQRDTRNLEQPIWAIVDATVVPAAGNNASIMPGCNTRRGVNGLPNLFSLIRESNDPNADYTTNIRQAWRVNIPRERIENFATRPIFCPIEHP